MATPVLTRDPVRYVTEDEFLSSDEWDGYELDRCYGYSDSASDLPMLEAVGHPVAVNPDGALERIAHQRGWPVVIFSRKTKTVMKRTTAVAGAVGVAGAAFAGGLHLGRHRP